jgi:glycosyltransferase involved in cell wall biosynthesis
MDINEFILLHKDIGKYFPNFTIIVSCYNKEHIVFQCIDLIKKTCLTNTKIIAINDASTDKTLEVLNNIKDIEIINNEVNKGWGYSNNKALEKTNTDYVVFIDADCLFGTIDWLITWYQYYKNYNNIGESGEIHYCNKLYDYFNIHQFLLNQKWINNQSKISKNIINRVVDFETLSHIGGNFKIFDTNFLKNIGGFCEDTNPVQMETEISIRIKSLGYDLLPFRIPMRITIFREDTECVIDKHYNNMLNFINKQNELINNGFLFWNPINQSDKTIYYS